MEVRLGAGTLAGQAGKPSGERVPTLDRTGGVPHDDLMGEGSATEYGLFGREESLRVLTDVLDRGGSAVAVGEPGLGKSSLLKVANQLAQRRGRRVLSVAPTQFDRGLPFAGLAELVNQCPEGAIDRLPAPQRRALAVALQRAEPDGREVDALAVPVAVRSLLTQLGEAGPVGLVIPTCSDPWPSRGMSSSSSRWRIGRSVDCSASTWDSDGHRPWLPEWLGQVAGIRSCP